MKLLLEVLAGDFGVEVVRCQELPEVQQEVPVGARNREQAEREEYQSEGHLRGEEHEASVTPPMPLSVPSPPAFALAAGSPYSICRCCGGA